MESKEKIEEMTNAGWKYRHASIYMQMEDKSKESGYTRLTYDLSEQTDESLAELRRWANTINLRFDPIKIVVRSDYFESESGIGHTINEND